MSEWQSKHTFDDQTERKRSLPRRIDWRRNMSEKIKIWNKIKKKEKERLTNHWLRHEKNALSIVSPPSHRQSAHWVSQNSSPCFFYDINKFPLTTCIRCTNSLVTINRWKSIIFELTKVKRHCLILVKFYYLSTSVLPLIEWKFINIIIEMMEQKIDFHSNEKEREREKER